MQTDSSLGADFINLQVWSSGRKHHPLKRKKEPSKREAEAKCCSNQHVNMGKSNKFDYTNRANSGAKLGHIIGAALQKEAEKVKKDAERHAHKARKQSVGSSGDSPEVSSTTHIIDLAAPHKDLGDEGVCALVDGLEIALRSGNSAASLALEDLNLCANGITTLSLALLAPIIELAKYDLKTLNLSGNMIKVETDEEAAQWELFLRAFQGCMKLRRLDFSGNVELGSKALEIFARVHTAEPPISPMPPGGEMSTLSLISEDDCDSDGSLIRLSHEQNGEGPDLDPAMSDGRSIKRRCGLRAIPFIIFNDVGLNTAGALWLSYVVQDHYFPTQLIDELNATLADSAIKTYQQDSNFYGIGWKENKSLDKEGVQLLEKTEAIKRQIMLDDGATAASPVIGDADSAMGDGDHDRRKSIDSQCAYLTPGSRRTSIRSIRTTDGGEHEVTELESARKKIMRHVITHDGAMSVQLWRSALKTVRASRMLLYAAPSGSDCDSGELAINLLNLGIPRTPTVLPPTPCGSSLADVPHLYNDTMLSVDIFKANTGPSIRASCAAKLAGRTNGTAGDTEQALTEVTNTPITPLIMQRPTHRKGAFSEGTDLHGFFENVNALVVRDDSPCRFVRHQQLLIARAASEGRPFRDRGKPYQHPKEVVERIVRFAVADTDMLIMSDWQRHAAIEWGLKRETLMLEREWLRKDESAQVLMLLDGIKCLAYGR